jgi:hypothetical protein
MSHLDDFEFDAAEHGRQLGHTIELGRGDYSERTAPEEEQDGMSRRDLLVKGAVGAAAVSSLGALAGRAAAAPRKIGKFTGKLRVITLGVQFPTPELPQRIKQYI